MSISNFDGFFRTATGHPPYNYQRRLAGGDEGRACESQLISIPTGLGKTAAVVLAWLWNRVGHPNAEDRAAWPRRLVFCLPMRTLVEQTRDEAAKWLGALSDAYPDNADLRLLIGDDHSPIVLMGGEEVGEWDIHPERPAILIGTQDMLLSRALNRGYGVSRARWPMHFGLLNNDALWVLDETQLMGVGVRTSAQLEGLRKKLGVALGCATWWASATLDSRLLVTPDHRALPTTLALDVDDLKNHDVIQRVEAIKRLAALPLTLVSDSAKIVDPYIEQLAAAVLERHQADTTTIVILNRVDRAKDLYAAFDKLAKKQALPRRLLVHSRFRPTERAPLSKQIKELGEKIIIATQAIEAGVDISARTLITELAPWSSLVQRFGRCNRKGEFNSTGGADIFWINLETDDPKAVTGLSLPYSPEQLSTARALLRQSEATGVSPVALGKLSTDEPLPETHILRRKDLVDLFDTTPDLAGLDIDVGRYIRDGEERDVQVYWRDLAPDTSPPDDIRPQRQELVRVSLYSPGGFKKFAEKNKTGIWLWNVLDGEWQRLRADRLAPGQIYLIDSTLGGYSATLGWTGEKSREPFPLLTIADQAARSIPRDGQDRDDESQRLKTDVQPWQSIETHTAHVLDVARTVLAAFPTVAPWAGALLTAARWHDVGKAHSCFQTFITAGRTIPPDLMQSFIAKSPWKPGSKHGRPHFRHELASALAWLQAGACADPTTKNLVAYLIATHHGKIRLSLRAMPGEDSPPETSADTPPLYARGVWQGDRLPPDSTRHLTLEGESVPIEPLTLDLSCMQMGDQEGRPSWTSRMLTLRDAASLGLFRLALLETLLRTADMRASALASFPSTAHLSSHELAADHRPLAQSPRAGETTPPLEQHPDASGEEHGFRKRAGGREVPARETRPEHATRFIETSRGLLSYTDLAPLLAERVQAVEIDLSGGAFADFPLSDELVLELHRRIVVDLIPEWGGRWRTVEVTVGRLTPPAPHLVPERMRNYGLDLQARWPEAAAAVGERTLEFLAFAEGRFLTVHPFQDFNGRTVRVFLGELLHRLDLPPVRLEAESEPGRAAYFAALEAADAGDFHPLMAIWRQRLSTDSSEG